MFTVKHAVMEILNKSKSLDEVLAALGEEDQAILLATFDLMKSKLNGSTDSMNTQDNGQWSLEKNTLDYSKMKAPRASEDDAPTLDYSKFNKPKSSDKPANTIDYSGPDFKPAKTNDKPTVNDKPVAKPASKNGAIARRDAIRAKHQEWVDNGAKGAGETDNKNALNAIRDRQTANKSEDRVQQIKDQYASKQPKPLSEEVADMKERHIPKPPKSDEEKVIEAKKKFRQESKLKAEEPFKNSIKASKRQTQSESKS